jgi:hypothetical protein
VYYDGQGDIFFRGGWPRFAEDHDLHQGWILMFNYHCGLLMRYGGDIFSSSSWEPQEESMMSITTRFFPQLRNQGMSIRRGADKRLKVMLDSLVTLQQGRRFTIKRVSVSSASSNVEPAHNTTKYFVPNLR